jgi:hypothetical protein
MILFLLLLFVFFCTLSLSSFLICSSCLHWFTCHLFIISHLSK